MQGNYRGSKQVRLPWPSYKRVWERKNKDERRSHWSLAVGDGTVAASLQSRIQSPPVIPGRGAAEAARR
jgi:hypothetical protein